MSKGGLFFCRFVFYNKSNENSHAAAWHSVSHLSRLTPAVVCLMQHLTFRPQHHRPDKPGMRAFCPERWASFPLPSSPGSDLTLSGLSWKLSPPTAPPPARVLNSCAVVVLCADTRVPLLLFGGQRGPVTRCAQGKRGGCRIWLRASGAALRLVRFPFRSGVVTGAT